MKAILLIDMPDGINVNEVTIGGNGNIYFMREGEKELIVGNIKNIKPMPKKHDNVPKHEYELGWNDCIEEIEG